MEKIKIGDLVEITNPVSLRLYLQDGMPTRGIVKAIDPDGILEVKTVNGSRITPHSRAVSVISRSTMKWR